MSAAKGWLYGRSDVRSALREALYKSMMCKVTNIHVMRDARRYA